MPAMPRRKCSCGLFLHRAKFEGRSKYSTWVHGIAIRTCLTIRRGRGRRQRHENVASDETIENVSPGTAAPTEGLSLDLMQMLEILDEEDRALVIMKYAENYSHEELAEMFGFERERLQNANQPGEGEDSGEVWREVGV